MKPESYKKLYFKINSCKSASAWISRLNLFITALTYAAYPMLALYLFLTKDQRLLRVILTALVSFVLVTAVRRLIPARRPYEVIESAYAIKKDKKGGSFPSRHVFSIFVIAMTFLYVYIPLGIMFLVLGLALAVLRVIGGVHFIKDVAAGAAIGILSGIVGLYII